MKIRLGISGFLLGMILTLGAVFCLPAGLYGEEKVHIVQRGETFYSIARVLGIKVEDLMKYNGISDPARLQAGQRLKVPGTEAALRTQAVSDRGESSVYRAVRGDTLYSIARKFSVTVASIMEANNLQPNYMLREGDSLKITKETSLPKSTPLPVEVVGVSLPVGAPAVQPMVIQGGLNTLSAETSQVNPSLRWPVSVRELGYMTGKLSGVVITGEKAESVNSLTRGTVLSAGSYRGFGKVVIVQVDGGYLYVYGGCESLSVKEGDKVGPGAELGKLGVDALTNKAQLFFMVYKDNASIDPAKAPRA